MMTLVEKAECFNGWATHGMTWLEVWKAVPNSERAKIEVEMAACCCAELDRSHKQKATRILQDYVWERAFLAKETTYERYEQSGYFKEKYRRDE